MLCLHANGVEGSTLEGVTGRLFPVVGTGERDACLRLILDPDQLLYSSS